MEKKLTNSGPLREPADKHSIYTMNTPHFCQSSTAGLTDHVWAFRELLTTKFEPMHNQSGSG